MAEIGLQQYRFYIYVVQDHKRNVARAVALRHGEPRNKKWETICTVEARDADDAIATALLGMKNQIKESNDQERLQADS